MNKAFIEHISDLGKDLLGNDFSIINVDRVYGGSVNESYCLHTNRSKYFIKLNNHPSAEAMFKAEKKGLQVLASTNTLNLPSILASGIYETNSFLLLSYIETVDRNKGNWESFGRALAGLHQVQEDECGFEEDNFIGSLHQKNDWTESWIDFFIENRLYPQLEEAINNGFLPRAIKDDLEKLHQNLQEIFPLEKASLLHGDLWSENAIVDQDSKVFCVDPSVYYGNREMDIAMAHLFGGFPNEMFAAYNEKYPLQKGWESRIDLCNLYPLIVHVNLFGSSYANRFMQQLKKYV